MIELYFRSISCVKWKERIRYFVVALLLDCSFTVFVVQLF